MDCLNFFRFQVLASETSYLEALGDAYRKPGALDARHSGSMDLEG